MVLVGRTTRRTRHNCSLPAIVRPTRELSQAQQSDLDLELGQADHAKSAICRLLSREKLFRYCGARCLSRRFPAILLRRFAEAGGWKTDHTRRSRSAAAD